MSQDSLISATELRRLLQEPHPPLLLDARPGPGPYAEGHLPGAHAADLDATLSAALEPGHDPARGGRHPLPAPEVWAARLERWGLAPGSRVVVYDDASGGNGGARLWWMLRASGLAGVRVLDGGLQAALEAGLAPTAEVPALPAPTTWTPRAWALPTVDLAAVDRLRLSPDHKVLDVRSRERHLGLTEPLDPVAGHIPGALNLPYTGNLDGQGRFLDPAALKARYLDLLAGTPPGRLVVHCGSGVTACHTLLALDVAGLDGAALYVGSWSEWCRNPLPRA
jgi:thiosulfate/3-mercaptopyruvate sulfurtransferase